MGNLKSEVMQAVLCSDEFSLILPFNLTVMMFGMIYQFVCDATEDRSLKVSQGCFGDSWSPPVTSSHSTVTNTHNQHPHQLLQHRSATFTPVSLLNISVFFFY